MLRSRCDYFVITSKRFIELQEPHSRVLNEAQCTMHLDKDPASVTTVMLAHYGINGTGELRLDLTSYFLASSALVGFNTTRVSQKGGSDMDTRVEDEERHLFVSGMINEPIFGVVSMVSAGDITTSYLHFSEPPSSGHQPLNR